MTARPSAFHLRRLVGLAARVALAAVVVIASSLVGLSLYARRSAEPVRLGLHPPTETEPALVYLNAARDRFIVAGIDGSVRDERDAGGSIHLFAMHPTGNAVAAWRETPAGAFELVIWQVGGGVRTLLGPTSEFPVGKPVWSSRGTEVAASLAVLPPPEHRSPGSPPISSRLLVVPANGQTATEIAAYGAEASIVPIALTDRVIAGVRGRDRYIVIDLGGKHVREDVTLTGLTASYGADSQQGLVFAVLRDGTTAQSETLRTWRIDGFNVGAVSIVSPTVNAPIIWRGREDIVFGTGTSLRALNLPTGTVRDLAAENTIVMPVAFLPTGDRLMVERILAPNLKVYELDGDRFKPALASLVLPGDKVRLVGWTTGR